MAMSDENSNSHEVNHACPEVNTTSMDTLNGTPVTFRDVRWRWGDLLIGFAPILLLRLVEPWLDWTAVPEIARWLWIPISLLAMAWMLGFPLWTVYRRLGRLPTVSSRKVVMEGVIAVPTLVVIWIGLAGVVMLWVQLVDQPALPDPFGPVFRSGDRSIIVPLMILAVAGAPIAEEVFVRGMLYNGLRQRWHPVIAAVVQAMVFGILHTFGSVHAVGAALIGLALAAVYEWRRTLLAPIFVHALQNTAAVAFGLWAVQSTARPILGIQGQAHEDGCLITMVQPDGGADAAGLRAGDVITIVDRERVTDLRDVAAVLQRKRAGDRIRLIFVRDGETYEVEAVLTDG